MSIPRCGAFVGIVAVAWTFSSPLIADGPAVELTVELGDGIAMAAIPAKDAPPLAAAGPAIPSCVIREGQDGQLDFEVTAAPSAGGLRAGAADGCSARDSVAIRTRARYTAVPFAPETIGRLGSCPTFSPDGKTVVFVKAGAGLVESRLETEGWTEPAPLPFASAASRDGDPFLSPDGSRLFFWSTRPTVEGGKPLQWSDQATPENLGIAINSPAMELDGYVSPDQKLLVFASDRPGGHGKLDLYVSHWMVGGWSPARNLGPAVNGPDDEFCPQVTRDGRLLLFGRSTPGSGIFQIDAAVLDDATP